MLIAVLVSLLNVAPLFALDVPDGRTIASVEFEPAKQPLPDSELDRLIAPIGTGQRYRKADVRSAIQSLFATGRFADIQVDATEDAEGVRLKFITEAQYFIGRVSVEGSPDPPSNGQLVSAAKLQLGEDFVRTDLMQATGSILERLRANGLYQATVSHNIQQDPRYEQTAIDFTISPGKRAVFGGLLVEGSPERPIPGIIRSTGWRRFWGPWRPMTESRLQSGIENVRSYYQKHNHLLAKITLSRLDYDEEKNLITPTLTIDAGPLVEVRTAGAKVSKGKLRNLLPIYQERSVDHSLLVEGRRNLVEYFQSQGYFDVDVDFEELPEDNGVHTIEYIIDRDGRHKLVSLQITGNKYFDDQTIRERLYIQPSTFLRFRHGRYSERYLSRDVEAVEDLYQSNGFADVKVTPKVTDDYNGKTGDIAVELGVSEGPQSFVSSMELNGATPEDSAYLTSLLHSTEGQPFSLYNVATDRDTILSYYYNNGYPQAQFDWSQTATGQHQVGLRFLVTPGPRKYVRDWTIGGLRTTNLGIVLRRISLQPGDPLSQIQIAENQRRLYDLGIFAKVETAIQNPEGVEASKYVLFQVEEARRYSMNIGFGAEIGRIGGGVTTFDAPAGTGAFSPRVSFGVSRLNFMGLGHTVSLQTRFSNFQQRALLSYFAPQFTGRENLNLTFTALVDHSLDVRTFESRRIEESIQLGQKLSRANTIQYRFTYRNVDVPPDSVKITPALIPIFAQSVRVGQLGLTFLQDRRDDPTDAKRGIYNSVDLGLSIPAFGSETDFTRLNVQNSSYHRLTRDLTFARTVTFGWINRLGGLPAIPLPERYFSGGASSQRAFPDYQAGPRDPITGFPLGGTALLMNSFELRFPLIGDNIGGVLFNDAGNVYSNIKNVSFRFNQRDIRDFDYMVQGFGFGIRYRTPVGPIRIDFSLSPNSPRFVGYEGSEQELLTCSAPGSTTPCKTSQQRISIFQFHFSLGQAF